MITEGIVWCFGGCLLLWRISWHSLIYETKRRARPDLRWSDGAVGESRNILGVNNWKASAQTREDWWERVTKTCNRFLVQWKRNALKKKCFLIKIKIDNKYWRIVIIDKTWWELWKLSGSRTSTISVKLTKIINKKMEVILQKGLLYI